MNVLIWFGCIFASCIVFSFLHQVLFGGPEPAFLYFVAGVMAPELKKIIDKDIREILLK